MRAQSCAVLSYMSSDTLQPEEYSISYFFSFYRCLAIADGLEFHNQISIFELATAAICDLGGPGLLEAVNLFVKHWQGF